MGSLVLLLANDDPSAAVGPAVAQRLGGLGVTSVTVLRDAETTAITLEGWAFDTGRSAEAAAAAVTGDATAVRVLRPVLESSIASQTAPVADRIRHRQT